MSQNLASFVLNQNNNTGHVSNTIHTTPSNLKKSTMPTLSSNSIASRLDDFCAEDQNKIIQFMNNLNSKKIPIANENNNKGMHSEELDKSNCLPSSTSNCEKLVSAQPSLKYTVEQEISPKLYTTQEVIPSPPSGKYINLPDQSLISNTLKIIMFKETAQDHQDNIIIHQDIFPIINGFQKIPFNWVGVKSVTDQNVKDFYTPDTVSSEKLQLYI